MIIMWTLETVAMFNLSSWWAWVILAVGLFAHLANHVEETTRRQ